MSAFKNGQRTKIGRSVYLVKNVKKTVVKYEPQLTNGVMQRLSRYMFRGSLPFKNEMYVNELLHINDFDYFKYPSSIVHNDIKRIDFEFVQGEEEFLSEPSEKELAVRSLIEYSKLWEQYKFGGFTGFALRNIESPLLKIFRSVLLSRHALSIKLKSFFVMFVFLLRKKITTPVLLHNDLQCKNVIRTKDGEVIFIDFEDTTIEHRLILVDVINILFNKRMLTLDKNLLNLFWDAFVQDSVDRKVAEKQLKEQVNICLLRMAFAPCSQDKLATTKLLSIVVDKQRFNEWWYDQ